MKTPTKFLTLVLVFASGLLPSILHAQGALTPPGAPAPTMKTLAQIEPRTPISAAPFTISSSGSYYLTTNVTVSSGDAITINANNVTLDLNGFAISSTRAIAVTDSAIVMGSVTNISIANGNISSGVTNTAAGVFGGSGFANGIYFSGNTPFNVRVKDVSVAGVLYYGIYLGTINSAVVEGCLVNGAGSYGIEADEVSDSTAINCGQSAIIASTANNCRGYCIGNGLGLEATTANNCSGSGSGSGYGLAGTTANNCVGFSSGSAVGVYAYTANNCVGNNSGYGYGLYVNYAATGCSGYSGLGTGLYAYIANNCYGTSTGSGYGVDAIDVATGCFGSCSSGTGLFSGGVATGCYGSSSTGTGLSAIIASVCHGVGTPALSVTHNVNSF